MHLVARRKARFAQTPLGGLEIRWTDQQFGTFAVEEGLDLCGPGVTVYVDVPHACVAILVGGLTRQAQLDQITLTLCTAGARSYRSDRREQQGDQHHDHPDHDQKFDEGEAAYDLSITITPHGVSF